MLDAQHVILYGSLASLAAGSATGVGALLVFLVRSLSARIEDSLLSAAAGVMLAATFFSLLLPGIQYAELQTSSKMLAVSIVIAGLMFGAIILHLINRYVPHEHFTKGKEGPDASKIARVWLFIIAITLHNFPEGMAVGVGFAGGNISNGVSLAFGIGLQNIPEGLAVAAALLAIGYSKTTSFMLAFATGLVEPVGGFLGSVAVSLAQPLMPVTLGFAAGAMLFVISDEIIPETHRRGYATIATFSLMSGFALMMFLDATLG
ncbi:MAG: ZIP family metal transporter [Gammaproteobacteria bacterium]|nr:ZIP family metal transporter [Gammaproteobacteria bacterium]